MNHRKPLADRKLVVGNWKMNGDRSALANLTAINEAASSYRNVDIGLAVPAPLLMAAWLAGSALQIGAQDIHVCDSGAHTGRVSAPMVKDAGASFVIVGHSECRVDQNESNEQVSAKATAARRHGLSVILCVGEGASDRKRGRAEAVIIEQLIGSLPLRAGGDWLSIAYEPVWAIGTGKTPSLADIAAIHATMRTICRQALGEAGDHIRLLYGGSVTPENAGEILSIPQVDGVLVGGASLDPNTFIPIIGWAARRSNAPDNAKLRVQEMHTNPFN